MKPTLAIILVTVSLVALLPLETLAVLTSLASVLVAGGLYGQSLAGKTTVMRNAYRRLRRVMQAWGPAPFRSEISRAKVPPPLCPWGTNAFVDADQLRL